MDKRPPWALIAAVTLSVLLHAGLLLGALWTPEARLSDSGTPVPIQARLIAAAEPLSETRSTDAIKQPPPQPQASAPSEAIEAAPAPRPKIVSAVPASTSVAPAPAVTSAPAPPPVASTPPIDPVAQARAAGYRTGAELDPPPRPLGDIDPEYPTAAGLREGTVVLQLLIGESGAVDDVVVISASPPGFFEASAIAAFGKAKFSPGRILGLPVRSQLTIAVDYTPTNRGGAVAGQGGTGFGRDNAGR